MLRATCERLVEARNGQLSRLIIAGALFEAVWFICVFNPGHTLVLGVTAVNLLLHYLFFCTSETGSLGVGRLRVTLCWVIVIAVAGICMDALLFQAGYLVLTDSVATGLGMPLWLGCLWVNFALALRFAFGFLQKSLLVAAVVGGVGGPLSYIAGAKLGGEVFLQSPVWFTLGVLALLWALFFAGAMLLARLDLFNTGLNTEPSDA